MGCVLFVFLFAILLLPLFPFYPNLFLLPFFPSPSLFSSSSIPLFLFLLFLFVLFLTFLFFYATVNHLVIQGHYTSAFEM